MRMKTEREKDRIKERRKKGARKYGQSKLKEARKGVWSCGLAVVIFLVIAGMLLLAYLSRGKTAAYIGGLGMSAMIFSWIGFFMALRGFKEPDRNHVTCRIGVVCHMIFIAGLTGIFLRGLL